MKLKRGTLGLAIGLSLIVGLSACDYGDTDASSSTCTHEYTWYAVTTSTCTEKGENEGICNKCGIKEYIVVEELGHSYTKQGVCERCGILKDGETPPAPEDGETPPAPEDGETPPAPEDGETPPAPEDGETPSAPEDGETPPAPIEKPDGWTLDEIYQKAHFFGWYNGKNEFLADVKNVTCSELKIGKLGGLSVVVDGYSVNIPDVRCEYETDSDETAYIYQVSVVNGELIITYADGTRWSYGKIAEILDYWEEGEKYVKEIAINKQNQVLLVYTNDNVKAVGKISTDELIIENSTLVYELNASGDGYSVVCPINNNLEEVVVPKTHRGKPVTAISTRAFWYRTQLTSIVIPDSVTSIGEKAFYNCESLISVTLGNSVTSIGAYAFYDCKSLISVTLGNSVTSIGAYAFCDCDSLTSIVIPDSVTSIVIPDSVMSIGAYAFYHCDNLAIVTLGNSVTSIDEYAFYWCNSLTSIIISNSVKRIGDFALYGSDNLTIYCEAEQKPSGWSRFWAFPARPVVWGYTK